MKLNENERRVLEALAMGGEDFGCFPFDLLAEDTGLDRKQVRRACRSLARKGLAEYHRGLWTEDGEPAGSGYCASAAGRKELEAAP